MLHACQKWLRTAAAIVAVLAVGSALPAAAQAEPTLTISSPGSGALVESPVQFSGTAEELLAEPIGEVTVLVYPGSSPSGTPVQGSGLLIAGSWSVSVPVGEGTRTAVAVGSEHGTSLPVTFYVAGAPFVTHEPSSTTVAAGESAQFTAAAGGTPAPEVRWQVSTDNGGSWNEDTGDAGATTDTLTVSSVSTGQSGYLYRAVFSNGSGTVASNAARLSVDSAPTVTLNPSSETVAAGSEAQFSSEASGSPSPGVQWEYSSNGGSSWSDYPGGSSTTLSIPNVSGSKNGWQFRAAFGNFLGTVHSAPATLTVEEGPEITGQPSDRTVVAGNPVSFSASARGLPAPSVRWEVSSDGGNTWTAAGSTSDTLTFTATSEESGNLYRAVFENSGGSAATREARLTVEVPPAVTANPQNVTLPAGERAEFTAAATGSPAPGVKWQYSPDAGASWHSIEGANSPTYITPPVTTGQSGYEYRAVFANAAGEAPTLGAVLTVHEGPHVTLQPVAQTVTAGAGATFTAQATGFPAPTVQWEVSSDAGVTWAADTTDAGNTTSSMTIAATAGNENGFLYRATFTNVTGSVTTQAAKLEVRTKPTVTVAPPKLVTAPGVSASFTASVTGNPAPAIHWEYQQHSAWSTLKGAAASVLNLEGRPEYNGLKFRAVATNTVGTATSEETEFEVTNAPAIKLQPESEAVAVGDPASFEAVATGNPTPKAEWQVRLDGGAWTKATGTEKTEAEGHRVTSRLLLSRTAASESGEQFRVVFANGEGEPAVSNPATLTVETAPVVTAQPGNANVPSGDTAYFVAQASGTPSPSLQWQESSNGSTWSAIAGANASTLAIPNVSPAQSGRLYRAVFTNLIGSATSSAASLTVVPHGPPAASFSWLPATPHAGESVSLVATASDAFSAINGYAWSLQGGPFAAGSATLTTSFATPGPHPVSLHVSSADGQAATVTKTIEVTPRRVSLMQPFPIVRIAGFDTRTGAHLRLLSVQAQTGAIVTINCYGRGCPVKKQVRVAASRVVHAGYLTLVFQRFERTFPGGTLLQIRVTYPGEIGKYTSLHIRRGRVPIRADACLEPSGRNPIGCPAP